MTLRERFYTAPTFPEFLGSAEANAELWHAMAARRWIPTGLEDRVRAIADRWHLLVLAEDWCGDAVNVVPVLAQLAQLSSKLDLRILRRDANPDVIDAHLTDGARSIPVLVMLDDDFVERAWWGPRPRELQQWVKTSGRAMAKEERYRAVRRWYARDRGVSIIREVLCLMERAA
jgi:hypothetical protein